MLQGSVTVWQMPTIDAKTSRMNTEGTTCGPPSVHVSCTAMVNSYVGENTCEGRDTTREIARGEFWAIFHACDDPIVGEASPEDLQFAKQRVEDMLGQHELTMEW
jgi:hypothetical protein